jgi:hypothetical protein
MLSIICNFDAFMHDIFRKLIKDSYDPRLRYLAYCSNCSLYGFSHIICESIFGNQISGVICNTCLHDIDFHIWYGRRLAKYTITGTYSTVYIPCSCGNTSVLTLIRQGLYVYRCRKCVIADMDHI